MAQLLPHVTQLKRFSPDIFDGEKIISNYAAFQTLLASSAWPELGKLLAAPLEKPLSNTIEWSTVLPGAPVLYEALNKKDKEKARILLCRKVDDLAKLGDSLARSKSDQRNLAGHMISIISAELGSCIADIPGPLSVFMVNGEPVLCGWGVSPAKKEKAPPSLKPVSPGAGLQPLKPSAPPPLQPPPPPPPPLQPGVQPKGSGEPLAAASPAPGAAPSKPAGSKEYKIVRHLHTYEYKTGWNFFKIFASGLATFLLIVVIMLALLLNLRWLPAAVAYKPPAVDAALLASRQTELNSLRREYQDRLKYCASQTGKTQNLTK